MAAQAPELRAALEVMKQKDGRRFFLKNTAPNLAGAELSDLVRAAIENNSGRITTSQSPAPREDAHFRQTFVTVQFFATTPALAKILAALDTQVPYVVVDNLTIRPLNAFRGFKPAPGQEPELNVQMDVSAWAYPELPKAAATVAAPARQNDGDRTMAMNGLNARVRSWLVWLLPFVVLALVIGWEADWGRKWRHVPVTDAAVVPQPVAVAVLPEYRPTATLATQRDIVERSLFNPTRRPAPVALADAAKKRLQPGQFLLTGTLIVDGKATAFLKESAGGKSRRVAQGEQINGMLVAEVKPDRVKLTLGEESEDLVLKVAIGPKTTTQPVVAPWRGGPAAGDAAGAGRRGNRRKHAGRAPQGTTGRRSRAAAGKPPLLNAPPAGAYLPPGGTAPAGAAAAVDPRWAEADARVRARVRAAGACRQNSRRMPFR